MHRKKIALLLAGSLLAQAYMPVSFAGGYTYTPKDWSPKTLERATEQRLFARIPGTVRANDRVTRAQMGAILNQLVGANNKASLKGYGDVTPGTPIYEEVAKAVAMGTLTGSGGKLYPGRVLTKEEALVMLAKAFKLSPAENTDPATTLKVFADQWKISPWAKAPIAALTERGYLKAYKRQLDPKDPLTFGELAGLLDILAPHMIQIPGIYTADYAGNVVINVPGVTLKNLKINGDLILGEGIGRNEIILDHVTIAGQLTVRSGPLGTVQVLNSSSLKSAVLAGSYMKLALKDSSRLESLDISGSHGEVFVEGGSSLIQGTIKAPQATVYGQGQVNKVTVLAANALISTPGTTIAVPDNITTAKAGAMPILPGQTLVTVSGAGVSKPPAAPDAIRVEALKATTHKGSLYALPETLALYDRPRVPVDWYNSKVDTNKVGVQIYSGILTDVPNTQVQLVLEVTQHPEAARIEALTPLYARLAKNPVPDVAFKAELEKMATPLIIPSTAPSPYPEPDIARFNGYKTLFQVMGDSPNQLENLKQWAIQLTASESYQPSVEAEVARVLAFETLYEAIGKNPALADDLVNAAREFTGPGYYQRDPDVQAARATSFRGLYRAIGKNLAAKDELIRAAQTLTGTEINLPPGIAQAARVASFDVLYTAMAENPQAEMALWDAATTLTGNVDHMSTPVAQEARAESFGALYQAAAKNPQMQDRLLTMAERLTGKAGDLTTDHAQMGRIKGYIGLVQAVAADPASEARLIALSKTLVGAEPVGDSPLVQLARLEALTACKAIQTNDPKTNEALNALTERLMGQPKAAQWPMVQRAN